MAEPRSPLVELVGRWRPIFADPERGYHYLTSIRSLRRTRRGARFALAVDDGSTVNLVVTFVRPEVVRVQLFLDEPPLRKTPMLVLDQGSPVELEFQSNDQRGESVQRPPALPAATVPVRSRPGDLPPGPWYDFWTNQRVDGPGYREVEVPLERIPLFVRGGSAMCVSPVGRLRPAGRRWTALPSCGCGLPAPAPWRRSVTDRQEWTDPRTRR